MLFLIMAKHQMRTLRWVLVAAVVALVSCGDGSSLTTSEAPPPPTDAGAQVVYRVGDTGPGGGIIFYVDEAGFNWYPVSTSIGAMCLTGSCHYLEMAPTDLDDGYAWSDAINAAQIYSTATADDWVLPSKDALNEMCKYAFRDTINSICNDNGDSWFFNIGGIFWHGVYRSSSEYDDFAAWSQSFGNGDQYTNLKYLTYSVRPVRAF